MEGPTNEISADESSSSGANLTIAMKHLVGVCLQGIGGCGFMPDVYGEFVNRFGMKKSGRLYQLMHGRLQCSGFVTVSKRDKDGRKSPSNFYTLNESKFEAFLQKCGVCRSEEHCLQIEFHSVNASLACDRHASMAPARKQTLGIPSSELTAMITDCLESECSGSSALGPIVDAVAARLNLPVEESGQNSTIYSRVGYYLRRSGRFQSTGTGCACVWTALGRPNSQEQERSRVQKRVLEVPFDEFITTMIDCLENECGGTATLAPIVAAVAARLNLPAEHSGRESTIYSRVRSCLHRSGQFQSTGTGCASTWTALGRPNSQTWSQPAVNALLRRVQKREQRNAAAERQKCTQQRKIAELERRVKELENELVREFEKDLEIEFGNEPQQNASDGIEGLLGTEIKFDPETRCLMVSMESGRVLQLVAKSSSVKVAISTANGLPAVGVRLLDNGSTLRPEWSVDRRQIRLSRQDDIDELLLGN